MRRRPKRWIDDIHPEIGKNLHRTAYDTEDWKVERLDLRLAVDAERLIQEEKEKG